MEKKTYTSGEIAKICHVSIRTVQYYDYEHIVKPSHLDESGRRQYSIEDLQHFQLVLLYKDLGLSLKEIREVFQENHHYYLLVQMLKHQHQKNDQHLHRLQKQNEKITILLEELQQTKQKLTVFNHDDLHHLVLDTQYQKTTHLTYLLLFFYFLIMIFTIIIIALTHLYFLVLLDVILLLLVKFHSQRYAYICPHCRHRYWMQETYRENF